MKLSTNELSFGFKPSVDNQRVINNINRLNQNQTPPVFRQQYLPLSHFRGWTVDPFGLESGVLGTPPTPDWWRDWKLGTGDSGRCEYINYSPGTGILGGGEDGAVHEPIGTLMNATMAPGFYRVRLNIIEFGVDQAVIILKNTMSLNPDQSVHIPPNAEIVFEAFGTYDYFAIKVVSSLPGQVFEINNISMMTLADDIAVYGA